MPFGFSFFVGGFGAIYKVLIIIGHFNYKLTCHLFCHIAEIVFNKPKCNLQNYNSKCLAQFFLKI